MFTALTLNKVYVKKRDCQSNITALTFKVSPLSLKEKFRLN
jgi:hypothetical protein